MEERSKEELALWVEQLQRERDELRKDIEQLCMQQAGPGYLAMATRMHFQRTAALEQEIESLTKRLAAFTREKNNLEEELSEAYRIKGQLAELHSAEVLKNKELEKQVKFFQGCVAAAFAERDNSTMEAQRSKEHEEDALQKMINCENRLEELQSAYLEEKILNSALQTQYTEIKEQIEYLEKIFEKFYEIRVRDTGISPHQTWQDKCSCLLKDPSDRWNFSDDSEASTSKYIASLEEELGTLRKSMDKLQSNMRMGLEIEQHLQKHVKVLEKKQAALGNTIVGGLLTLCASYNQHKVDIIKILDDERAYMLLTVSEIEKMISKFHKNNDADVVVQNENHCNDTECKDVHINSDINANTSDKLDELQTAVSVPKSVPDPSDPLAQALQEKVAALLLLSQQEERHMLERDMNKALQEKVEELQKNLLQVTNEKVMALLELAQLKQQYQLSQEKNTSISDKVVTVHEREGKLRTILKSAYLKRWIGKDHGQHETDTHESSDSTSTMTRNYSSIDFARLQVENATLQESVANIERLTSSIHRLRLALVKVLEARASCNSTEDAKAALEGVLLEAKQMKMALSSSLPVSWSGDSSDAAVLYASLCDEPNTSSETPTSERVDTVCATGLEMVELLIIASELVKEREYTLAR